MQTWESDTVDMFELQYWAEQIEDKIPAFTFLQGVGIVPETVSYMPKTDVRLGYEPTKVPAGYLAKAAYEWDQWGSSHPTDFVAAILAECRGATRDNILETLAALSDERREALSFGVETDA